ncbi:hypothetical protein [Streptomyces sp. NPDC051642]|uniref:hypothetical protein n=1 Tax=unclassified Streptomyces TaxID=2593676 RepID=UPI0034355D37
MSRPPWPSAASEPYGSIKSACAAGIFNAIEVIGYFAYLPVVVKPCVRVSAGNANGDGEHEEGQQRGAVRRQLENGGAVMESSPVVLNGTR